MSEVSRNDPVNVAQWTVDDVAKWIEGLEDLNIDISPFRNERVDGAMLRRITREDLKTLIPNPVGLEISKLLSQIDLLRGPRSTITQTNPYAGLNIDRLEPLGRGSFGKTYKGLDRKQQRYVAVKTITCGNSQRFNEAMKEIIMLSKMESRHIVGYLDSYFNIPTGQAHIVMEYCTGGDLHQYLLNNNPLPSDVATRWLFEIASALHHLHSQQPVPIFHRDIKPSNIFLTGDPLITKLGDLGLTERRQEHDTHDHAGTRGYMPPEAIKDDENYILDSKADMWALGIVALEMAARLSPGRVADNKEKAIDGIPRDFPEEYKDAVKSLLEFNGADRINADQLMELLMEGVTLKSKLASNEDDIKEVLTSAREAANDAREMITGALPLPQDLPYEILPPSLNVCVARFRPLVNNDSLTGREKAIAEATESIQGLFSATGGRGPTNKTVLCEYDITDIAVVRGTHRAISLVSTAASAIGRYGQGTIVNDMYKFESSEESKYVREWQKKISLRLTKKYHKMIIRHDPHAKITLAFHVTNQDCADKILTGNFVQSANRDQGFFGRGSYFSLDALYALTQYSDDEDDVALVMCLVLLGNSRVITERSTTNGGSPGKTYGKDFDWRIDSHITVINQDDNCEPAAPKDWDRLEQQGKLHTEIAVKHSSQILPLGYVMMKKRSSETSQESKETCSFGISATKSSPVMDAADGRMHLTPSEARINKAPHSPADGDTVSSSSSSLTTKAVAVVDVQAQLKKWNERNKQAEKKSLKVVNKIKHGPFKSWEPPKSGPNATSKASFPKKVKKTEKQSTNGEVVTPTKASVKSLASIFEPQVTIKDNSTIVAKDQVSIPTSIKIRSSAFSKNDGGMPSKEEPAKSCEGGSVRDNEKADSDEMLSQQVSRHYSKDDQDTRIEDASSNSNKDLLLCEDLDNNRKNIGGCTPEPSSPSTSSPFKAIAEKFLLSSIPHHWIHHTERF